MNLKILYQWQEEIARHMPSLNTWQVNNVALFSQGIIYAESCQQEQIARQVACGERVRSAARRLRRFLANQTLDLERVFADWTRWILAGLESTELYLCVDETKLSERMATMMVGIAWEGRCIPVAWRCYDPHAYPAEGQVKVIEQLLQAIQPSIPDTYEVCVLADRGIGTSPTLCQAVADLGWSYLFRVTCQTKLVTPDADYTIYDQVQPGTDWQAAGLIFKQRGRLPAYAVAVWEVGYDEPLALVSNNARFSGHEYATRGWQEQSFRDLKRCGWQWDTSHIRHPAHMTHLLLLLVLAYAWMLALGSYAVAIDQAQPLQRHRDGTIRRHWSLFKEGLQFFTDWVLKSDICLKLLFLPDKRFT